MHRLKQQLQGELDHASAAAERVGKANGEHPDDRQLLTCQEHETNNRRQIKAGEQDVTRELSVSDCSGSSSEATWLLDDERMWAHEEGSPDALTAGQCSLPQLSREDSANSALSAYSAEHLAATWEAIMSKSRAEALTGQLQPSKEPFVPTDEASCMLPASHDETAYIAAGQHPSCRHEDAPSPSAQEAPPGPQIPLGCLQTGEGFAASHDSNMNVWPIPWSGSSYSRNEAETGTEQGHGSPIHNWPKSILEAGKAASEPSSGDSTAYLSDSDDNDDELARLEAKYGIHNLQPDI